MAARAIEMFPFSEFKWLKKPVALFLPMLITKAILNTDARKLAERERLRLQEKHQQLLPEDYISNILNKDSETIYDDKVSYSNTL